MAETVRIAVPEALARDLVDAELAVPARAPRGPVGDVFQLVVDGIATGANVVTVVTAAGTLQQLVRRARRTGRRPEPASLRVTAEGPGGRRTFEIPDGTPEDQVAEQLAAFLSATATAPADPADPGGGGSAFDPLPPAAAWRHQDAREGFESVFLRPVGSGYQLDGHTAAVEDGQAWVVRYRITLDDRWVTRAAHVWGWSVTGERETQLTADGSGRWKVEGSPAPELDGCLDVDLESSAGTNTFPVHRLRLAVGEAAQAPAAYVRATDLRVERLEQTYTRLGDEDGRRRYGYVSPAFDFRCQLVYDASGLVLDYPGIAARAH